MDRALFEHVDNIFGQTRDDGRPEGCAAADITQPSLLPFLTHKARSYHMRRSFIYYNGYIFSLLNENFHKHGFMV
jgi:hypothetical protein